MNHPVVLQEPKQHTEAGFAFACHVGCSVLPEEVGPGQRVWRELRNPSGRNFESKSRSDRLIFASTKQEKAHLFS